MRNKLVIVAGLVIATVAALLILIKELKKLPRSEGPAHVAPTICSPSWELPAPDGKPIKSTDFAGKVVILNFWATWCGPCRMEIPSLIELHQQYADEGLTVIGVSLDRDGAETVQRFIEQTGIKYQVFLGDEGLVNSFGGIEGIPTTFILDQDGHVVGKHVGFASKEEFEADITPLLTSKSITGTEPAEKMK